MMWWMLIGCPFPDWEPPTDPTDPVETPVPTGHTGTPTPVTPMTPPQQRWTVAEFPRVDGVGFELLRTGWVTGPFVAMGHEPPADTFAVRTLDDAWATAATWSLPNQGTPDLQAMARVGGLWDGEALVALTTNDGGGFSYLATVADDGLVTTHDAPLDVAPPFYARSAVALEDSIVVASGDDNAWVGHLETPSGPVLGSWDMDDLSIGDGGRFLAVAQLDEDAAPELLVGTGGDASSGCANASTDCNVAGLWGLELPNLADTPVSDLNHSRIRFLFRTDGATTFTPPVGVTGTVLDVDGDGCDDLLVGAPFDDDGRGKLHVIDCLADEVASGKRIPYGDRAAFVGPVGGYLGSAMVVLDGFLVAGRPAVAISAPGGAAASGRVYVLPIERLVPGAELDLTTHTDGWMEIYDLDTTTLGASLTNLGDLNDDGRDDLAIGFYDVNVGGASQRIVLSR